MTEAIRTEARRYALSMPIIEVGFFTLLIVAMAVVG